MDAGRTANELRLVAKLPALVRDDGVLVFLEKEALYVPSLLRRLSNRIGVKNLRQPS
jgi:hypothetical protein